MSKHEIKFPNRAIWEKLILRWSEFPTCGEKKLIAAVIAAAIADDNKEHELESVANKSRFFGERFEAYCKLIALDSDFLRKQVLSVAGRVGEFVEVPA
jgi:hypothetical protein